jgi:tetratricopeptide (TPR) repeat protein
LPRPLGRAEEPFVGREAELARVRELWAEAGGGASRAATLAGEAGIGKTRLCAELAAEVQDAGGVVLYGRCEQDVGLPYQPFVEAVTEYLALGDNQMVLAELGEGAAYLGRVVPALAGRVAPPAPPPGEAEVERLQLFDAATRLFAAVAREHPLLLVLDDLHWATKPTLLLLRHLVRAPDTGRVLVLCTYRDSELDTEVADVLAQLRREGVARLRLGGLDEPGVRAFLQGASGRDLGPAGDELVRGFMAETEGNPFFMREVLTHLVEAGAVKREAGGRYKLEGASLSDLGLPEGVREVVSRRLGRLSEPTVQALRAAAVIGPRFTLAVLEGVTGVGNESDELFDALEEAIASGIVAEVPGPAGAFEFSHSLIRRTLLEQLSTARRLRLHRQIAEVLESLPAGTDQVEVLAYHCLEAAALEPSVDKAVGYASAAGSRAMERLAFEQAATFFERGLGALELVGESRSGRACDLLLALAEARAEAGDRKGNQQAALAAADLARALGLPDRLGRAAVSYAGLDFGVPDGNVPELCDDALAALGDENTAMRARVLSSLAAYRAFNEGDLGAGLRLAEEAVGLARRSGHDSTLRRALNLLIGMSLGSPDASARMALVEELLGLAVAAGDRRDEVVARFALARGHLRQGDRVTADAVAAEAVTMSTAMGGRLAGYLAGIWETEVALLEGRFGEVGRLSGEVAAKEPAFPVTGISQALAGQIFVRSRERGRVEALVEGLEVAVRAFPQAVIFSAALALVEAELGRLDEARDHVERVLAEVGAEPYDAAIPASLAFALEAAVLVGACTEAAALASRVEEFAGQLLVLTDGVAPIGAADRFLGMAAAATGRFDEAEGLYRSAMALEAAIGGAPLLARTRYWYARLLVERRTAGAADDERTAALVGEITGTARALGMTRLEEHAAALLRRG